MTSPTGPAMPRAARPTTRNATRMPSPMIQPNGANARCPPGPGRRASSVHVSTFAANSRPKKTATTRPTRRRNRVRTPRHAAEPDGGKGSPSGHHGGRKPGPRWNPAPRQCPGPRGRSPGRGWPSGSLIGEPIAHPVHREEVSRLPRGGLDLPPDVLHVRVDGALVRLDGDAVDRVEQLGPGEHAAGLADQRGEEVELRRCEVDRPAFDRHTHPEDVDLHAGRAKDL